MDLAKMQGRIDLRVNRIVSRMGAGALAEIAMFILAVAATVVIFPAIASAQQSLQSPGPAAIVTPAAPPSAVASPEPSPGAEESPAIAPGWAPQPGTAAYDAAQAEAAPSSSQSPAANPSTAACCPALDHHGSPGQLTAGERDYYHTRDGSYLDSASWAVMAFKSRHELGVYYKGRIFNIYHAVFGRSHEHGTKLYEGDRRTPEGVYILSGKHPSARWHWFLTLDYPNAIDRLRYAALRVDDVAPAGRDGRVVGEGGSIGIHGTDVPLLNAGNINWTTGCISVDNRDVAQLHRLLPIGTVVIIKP
ncbi:MAG: L,D-transpeptidase family protein [Candidatus Binataceae bacterium]